MDESTKITLYVNHTAIHRNKRCLLAYLYAPSQSVIIFMDVMVGNTEYRQAEKLAGLLV